MDDLSIQVFQNLDGGVVEFFPSMCEFLGLFLISKRSKE